MKKAHFLPSALLLVLLLAACTRATVPATPAPPASAGPSLTSTLRLPVPLGKEAWEVEWEKVQAEAKREGLLTFAISAGRPAQIGLTNGFKEKFGIHVESIAGSGGDLSRKILAERKAGVYLWDVFIDGAGTQIGIFKPGGGSSPLEAALILPDLTNPEAIERVWHGGRLHWVDEGHYLLTALRYNEIYIAINTNLVKPGEVKSFDDLLNPKWKGKILFMNPTIPSRSDTSLMPMLYEVKGEDWVRKLAAQDPQIIGDDRLGIEWLAHGKYPIYMPPQRETFLLFVGAGAPIAAVETEDIAGLESGPTGVALIGNAPHPSAAKLFINFYLSKEGQMIISKARLAPSGRLDVPTEVLPSWSLVKPGRNYWIKDTEEVLLKVPGYKKKSKEIFRHLIK